MPKISYVNGRFVPHQDAVVHIEDRGFQFADGIYEVISSIGGKLADEGGHLDRLERSLRELQIDMPVSRDTLGFLMREVLRKNRLRDAAIYIQITRGEAKRDFKFPDPVPVPTLVISAWPFDFDNNPAIKKGIKAVCVPDQRWARRDIKTVALLPQALAKQKAKEAGAQEAWMIDDKGYITEGSSSNAWIVKGDVLQTRLADTDILKGVTRTAIQKVADDLGLQIVEKSFKPADACKADECFGSSATALIAPIVEIDGHKIGSGKPGPITKQIYKEYRAYVDGMRGDPVEWSME